MHRRFAPVLLLVAGCASDDAVLSKLDGPYEGTLLANAVEYPLLAEFEWRKDEELLFGRVQITLDGEGPSTWAVRRWEVQGDTVYLDLTDGLDITRGMDLDGVPGKDFDGDCTISFPCETGTCGYQGSFTLSPGGPGVPETTPTDSVTGT